MARAAQLACGPLPAVPTTTSLDFCLLAGYMQMQATKPWRSSPPYRRTSLVDGEGPKLEYPYPCHVHASTLIICPFFFTTIICPYSYSVSYSLAITVVASTICFKNRCISILFPTFFIYGVQDRVVYVCMYLFDLRCQRLVITGSIQICNAATAFLSCLRDGVWAQDFSSSTASCATEMAAYISFRGANYKRRASII